MTSLTAMPQHRKGRLSLPGLLLVVATGFVAVSTLLLHRLECDVEGQIALFPPGNSTDQVLLSTPAHGDEWPHPFIHIVNTRFMQHQGDLVDLARARLRLFETFCLDSVLGQTILQDRNDKNLSPLLWIIKVDPQLGAPIVEELLSLVSRHSFIYVVASNVNFGIGVSPGGWRGGEAGQDVLNSTVHCGDMRLFRQAHASRETRAILDTRLDADDGLHTEYLETIQVEALMKLRWSHNQTSGQRQRWKYWCIKNRLDWDPPPPFAEANDTDYGVFIPKRSPEVCITPGITLGISIGPEEEEIPHFPHHELYSNFRSDVEHPDCGGRVDTRCLRMLGEPILGAIRSRTPTSAGMRGVTKDEEEYEESSAHSIPTDNKHLLHALETSFHVSLAQIIKTNRFLRENFEGIVVDNLRGQCTHDHSCKNSTKEALERWLERSRSKRG